jgi:hypothetical protein
MKNEKELRDFFYNTLMPDLAVLEAERKKIVKKFLIISAVSVAAIALFLMLRLSGWLIGICVFGWLGAYAWITEGYVKNFKEKVIRRIVRFIDPNLEYIKEGHIPLSAFTQSGIFKRRPDRYGGDDFVGGKIGETQLAFSEIHAEYRSGSGRNRHYETIFKGLFFIADFNKSFMGRTIVLPDTAERLFGHMGTLFQSWNVGRDPLVKLEDPEFEKLFAVYGTDQIQSRYILSTSLMKRITDFRKKTGKNVFLSFTGSKIFVALSYYKDLFEPNVFRTLLKFDSMQEYYNDLGLAVGIVEDLNLNTRIWTKR